MSCFFSFVFWGDFCLVLIARLCYLKKITDDLICTPFNLAPEHVSETAYNFLSSCSILYNLVLACDQTDKETI